MNLRRLLWAVITLLLLTGSIQYSTAQSVLPAINAVADSGLVTLNWVCQYDGVKSIAVKRSVDSNANFATIGYVKEVTKGAQYYTDYAPVLGTGYYKLSIVFNSGLSWSSNVCNAASYQSRKVVQKGSSPTQVFDINAKTLEVGTTAPHYEQQVKIPFRLSYPDMDMNDASFIQPRFVFIHKVFDHVVIKLPLVNFKQHLYSVRFFNSNGVIIVDVPHIKLEEVIIDNRNFARSGTYKYVIRRDGVLFESGYIKLSM
jgi:hypothetical protein